MQGPETVQEQVAAGGRRHEFLKAAGPGLVSWAILITALYSPGDIYDFLQFRRPLLLCFVFAAAWGVCWMVIAIQRRSIIAGLGALVTLSFALCVSLLRID